MFKRVLLVLLLSSAACTWAQTAALNGWCDLGGTSAQTQGLNSTNKLQGVIPSCQVSVYLTGTTTLATIYANAGGTPLSNPFTAAAVGSAAPGQWLFWAAVNQGYDVVASGGIAPNTYPQPVTLCADCYPGFSFSPGNTVTIQTNSTPNASQSTLNFSNTAPAAPAGYTNVLWQNSGGNESGYVPTAPVVVGTSYFVPATTIPWDPTLPGNSALPFANGASGSHAGTPPVVVATGLTAGQTLTLSASGTASAGVSSGWPFYGPQGGSYRTLTFPTDPTYGTFPLSYVSGATPTGPIQMMGLMGAFTDGSGNVIQAVAIGANSTLTVPASATQLQVGVNDIDYPDNSGSFSVAVNIPAGNTATLPANSGTTTNPLTAAASGGAAPGTTFNGSAAVTLDYHSLGAAGVSGTPATGNCVDWASANTLGDTGSPCGSGGGGGALTAVTSIQVNGTNCAIEWENSAGTVVKIELFACAAITDYANGATAGSLEWAITQLSPNGGLVLMHPGIYNISESVLINWDHITIRGTQLPYWDAYLGAWPTHAAPGTPGGAQIVSTGAGGYPTFQIGNSNFEGDVSNRHKGIQIQAIYGYGAYLAGTYFIGDITANQDDDDVRIEDNIMQGYESCVIQDQWDYHDIFRNTIQSNGGDGVCEAGGEYGYISGNIIYDNGGEGVTLSGGTNTMVAYNRFGNLTSAGTLSGGTGEFTNNVMGGFSGAALTNSGGTWKVAGTIGGVPTNSTPTSLGGTQFSSGATSAIAYTFTDNGPAASYMTTLQALAPNAAAGDAATFGVGRSASINNAAFFGLHYAGNGSASNYGFLSIFGSSDLVSWWPNGFLGVGYNSSTGAPPSPFSVTSSNNTPLYISSSNTCCTQFEMVNTTSGAHSYNFFTNGSAGTAGWGGIFDVTAAMVPYAFEGGASTSYFNLPSIGVRGWTSSATRADGAPDTGLSRVSAGVIAVGNGSNGNATGTVKAAAILPGVIYSAAGTALPACAAGIKGQLAVVSDATSPTYLGTYTSGGAVVSPVMCNGTNWVTY